jgi:hypothetical protein
MLPKKRINFLSREQAFSCRGAAQFNERTSGNGAIALWFDIPHSSRAVPECER